MKTCMHSLSFSGIVHQNGRRVAECGPVAKEIGDVSGLSVHITQNSGHSAYLPIVTMTFSCSGMSSNDVILFNYIEHDGFLNDQYHQLVIYLLEL